MIQREVSTWAKDRNDPELETVPRSSSFTLHTACRHLFFFFFSNLDREPREYERGRHMVVEGLLGSSSYRLRHNRGCVRWSH